MDDQRAAYVALAMMPGMGPTRLRTLLEACQTPNGAYSAPFAFLRALPHFSAAIVTAIKATSPAAGQQVLDAAGRLGARVLLPSDPEYPQAVTEIPDPPPLLFALGDLTLLDRPAAAIVGSRDHSLYGAEVCRRFAGEFAAAGGVVVSGMARGLDAVAHGAALDANGGTIGVLGNGLGVIYPAANRALYERVTAHGLLLTEFPPGERPNAGSFPRRNRLISALSRVTVVIEAAEGSGALITADAALNQGREVMAVPGPITSPTSVGSNRLIRDGAAPLLESIDLFTHYPALTQVAPAPAIKHKTPAPLLRPLPSTLSPTERAVADLLDGTPKHIDEIAGQTTHPIHEVLATLCSLEITGLVQQHPGRRFRRT
jgi:DNA processing protein